MSKKNIMEQLVESEKSNNIEMHISEPSERFGIFVSYTIKDQYWRCLTTSQSTAMGCTIETMAFLGLIQRSQAEILESLADKGELASLYLNDSKFKGTRGTPGQLIPIYLNMKLQGDKRLNKKYISTTIIHPRVNLYEECKELIKHIPVRDCMVGYFINKNPQGVNHTVIIVCNEKADGTKSLAILDPQQEKFIIDQDEVRAFLSNYSSVAIEKLLPNIKHSHQGIDTKNAFIHSEIKKAPVEIRKQKTEHITKKVKSSSPPHPRTPTPPPPFMVNIPPFNIGTTTRKPKETLLDRINKRTQRRKINRGRGRGRGKNKRMKTYKKYKNRNKTSKSYS